MMVNDLAKMHSKYGHELKTKQTIEIFSKIIQTLNLLQSNDPIPNSLCIAYKELYEIDKETGVTKIDSIFISDLCQLCRVNDAAELLSLTNDEQKENLASIEHTILLNHND